jgi:hypothetical protein
MSIEHISKFITDLAMHFSPPRFEHEQERVAWQKSIMRELHGAAPQIIEHAARHIIQTRKNRYFPLVAECREAIREAARVVDLDRHLETLPTLRKSFGDEWTTERVKLAYDLIKSGIGKQAARDNPCWTLALWNFCRRTQRLPEKAEVEQLKREARGFDEAYAKCVRGEAGLMSKSLEKLGSSILAKRKRLSEEVLGP